MRNTDKEIAMHFNFKGVKVPVCKKDYAKIEKKKFPLVCLVMKIKHHTVFILQSKLLKSILI